MRPHPPDPATAAGARPGDNARRRATPAANAGRIS